MVTEASPLSDLTELFGGAMVAKFPTHFVDASNYREVPSTQEIYVSSTYDSDISIIVEVLEMVTTPDSADVAAALTVHWEEVSEEGLPRPGATETVVLGAKAFTMEGPVTAVTGVLMTVIRLEDVKTDLVVTVNVPGWEAGEPDGGKIARIAREVRDVVLATLKLLDWQLFVNE